METITEAVARQARERPRSIALVDGGTRLSWGEVKPWADRAAGWLLALGLPRGATVLGERALYVYRTGNRSTGVFEADEEAVSRMIDLTAAARGEQASEGLVVPAHQVFPGLVADDPDQISGADDVGKHERSRLPLRRHWAS